MCLLSALCERARLLLRCCCCRNYLCLWPCAPMRWWMQRKQQIVNLCNVFVGGVRAFMSCSDAEWVFVIWPQTRLKTTETNNWAAREQFADVPREAIKLSHKFTGNNTHGNVIGLTFRENTHGWEDYDPFRRRTIYRIMFRWRTATWARIVVELIVLNTYFHTVYSRNYCRLPEPIIQNRFPFPEQFLHINIFQHLKCRFCDFIRKVYTNNHRISVGASLPSSWEQAKHASDIPNRKTRPSGIRT